MSFEDVKENIKKSNDIIKGVESSSSSIKKQSDKLYDLAIDAAITYNLSKPPYTAYSLTAAAVDADMKKIIRDINATFEDFYKELKRYLAKGYSLSLTKKDEKAISEKSSVILDELLNNTEILKSQLKAILYDNLGKGVQKSQLVRMLKDLYPSYSKNAYTIVNTSLSRLFTDSTTSKFSDEGYDWYIWAGPNDSLTREIPCKKWVWHRFPKSQLGVLRSTRQSLYNCRHSIIPIPNEDIDQYDLGRIKYA